MEISPVKVFYMIATSIAFGFAMGFLNDLNRMIRILLGECYGEHRFNKAFNIRLPLSHRPIGNPKEGILPRPIKHCIIFLQDLFLLLLSGIGVSLLNYFFNNGRARLYTPLAVIIGFVIHYFTIGKATVYFSDFVVFFIRGAFLSIFELLYIPLRYFFGLFCKFVKKIYTNINKSLAKKQKIVYNNIKKSAVISRALQGFVDVTNNDLEG